MVVLGEKRVTNRYIDVVKDMYEGVVTCTERV